MNDFLYMNAFEFSIFLKQNRIIIHIASPDDRNLEKCLWHRSWIVCSVDDTTVVFVLSLLVA